MTVGRLHPRQRGMAFTLLALLVLASCGGTAGPPATAIPPGTRVASPASPALTNPVRAENARPGTDAWQLGRPGFRTADDAAQQIKGYASATSVNVGWSIA